MEICGAVLFAAVVGGGVEFAGAVTGADDGGSEIAAVFGGGGVGTETTEGAGSFDTGRVLTTRGFGVAIGTVAGSLTAGFGVGVAAGAAGGVSVAGCGAGVSLDPASS